MGEKRANDKAVRILRFGAFELDTEQEILYERGHRVALQEMPLKVLVLLLEDPGRLVAHETFYRNLWPDDELGVLEDNLYTAVRKVRQVLHDNTRHPQFIETVPRKGYRFIAPVSQVDASADLRDDETALTPITRRRVRPETLLLTLVLLGVSVFAGLVFFGGERVPEGRSDIAKELDPNGIAVLPLLNLSEDPGQEYFAIGMQEELLTRLSRISALKVISRTSAQQVAREDLDMPGIASRLGVRNVMEGSVRRADDRVRVTLQLIDAASDRHLWAENFDRPLDDIFAIQDEIALAVADTLELSPHDDGPEAKPPNPDSKAYSQFLKARFFFNRRGPGDLERAGEEYRQAVEDEPEFARAWAGLAGVYNIQTVLGELTPDEGLPLWGEAAERAVELDPTLPEARMRAFTHAKFSGDEATARLHRKAMERYGNNNPLILSALAGFAASDMRWDEAIELQRRAVELEPLGWVYHGNLSSYLLSAGRLAESKAVVLEARELADRPIADVRRLIRIHLLKGQPEQALELLEQLPDGLQRDHHKILVFDALGRRTETSRALEQLMDSAELSAAVALAEIFAQRGEIDRAFEWIAAGPTRMAPDPLGFKANRFQRRLLISPFLHPLQTDLRWHLWVDDPRLPPRQ